MPESVHHAQERGTVNEFLSPHGLRRAMLVKGQTVQSLAFRTGVNPGTIYRVLNGDRVKNATLARIAQTLTTLPDVVSAEVADGVLAG